MANMEYVATNLSRDDEDFTIVVGESDGTKEEEILGKEIESGKFREGSQALTDAPKKYVKVVAGDKSCDFTATDDVHRVEATLSRVGELVVEAFKLEDVTTLGLGKKRTRVGKCSD